MLVVTHMYTCYNVMLVQTLLLPSQYPPPTHPAGCVRILLAVARDLLTWDELSIAASSIAH